MILSSDSLASDVLNWADVDLDEDIPIRSIRTS